MDPQATYLVTQNGNGIDQLPSASSSGFTSLPSAHSELPTPATRPVSTNGVNGHGERSYPEVSHTTRRMLRFRD
jgi:hypothetical protein